jgi:hypothetical protein
MRIIRNLAPCLIVAFLLTGCAKPKDKDADKTDVQQHNEDVNNTKNESDNLNTDINNVLKDAPGFQKHEGAVAYSICGGTVDDSHQYDATPTLYINFNGTSCGNPARKRSGQVKIELIAGSKWGDAGSMLRVTHTNYKVVFENLNNHYVILNGVKYLTNVVAADWAGYYFTGNVQLQVKERTNNMTVEFENGGSDLWNHARRSTISVTGYTNITATVNADTIINGKNIDSWGTTRFGTNFITEMVTPWKSGTACGWLKPTQGKYTSVTDNFTVTATASVDQNGNVVTGCNGYGYLLEWQYSNGNNNASGELVVNYF